MSPKLMKSKFVCRPPDFFQILVVASPGPYARADFFYAYFFVFVNMGPYGSETFKTLFVLQIAAESFQTFPEFSSQWSPQNTLGFLKF